jgi:hypothetical protein
MSEDIYKKWSEKDNEIREWIDQAYQKIKDDEEKKFGIARYPLTPKEVYEDARKELGEFFTEEEV